MQAMYIVYSESSYLPPLGFGVLSHNEEETEVQEKVIIAPFKNYPYFNKRYLNALNSGVISQSLYDFIIANQVEEQAKELIYTDSLAVNKNDILALIEKNNIQGIQTNTDTPSIIKQLKEQNLIIVKKL